MKSVGVKESQDHATAYLAGPPRAVAVVAAGSSHEQLSASAQPIHTATTGLGRAATSGWPGMANQLGGSTASTFA